MTIGEIIAVISFAFTMLTMLVGEVIALYKIIKRIANAAKCQLRTEMLDMYYAHRDSKEWYEWQRENFDKLFLAYEELHGNSFISDVREETRSFKVIR